MILIEGFNIVDSVGKVQVDSRIKKTACRNTSRRILLNPEFNSCQRIENGKEVSHLFRRR
jgi:hypothetical protein